ncbi:MAG TPA: hypothetical protein VN602_02225 [Gemmatimonadaceae bacterium]|nr:hypothetical protein [Gemmatimonadaceae bacterium]
MSDFVKSATTSTPVAKTQADLISMLGRYGATGFGFRRQGSIVSVTFHLPRAGADDQTVEIPVDLTTVRAKLDGPAMVAERRRQRQATAVSDDQTERVAWRVLYLWVDAALSAVSLGAQSIEEAFFAHLVVTSEGGKPERLVEYMAKLAAASGNMLPSPTARRLGSGS